MTQLYTIFIRLIIIIGYLFHTAKATKHSFKTSADDRFFIGPIGIPYGFLSGGTYNLTVFDYQLTTPTSTKFSSSDNKQHDSSTWSSDGLYPGFLLKRFKSESDFTKFQNNILENAAECVFQNFLDRFNDEILDDDIEGLQLATKHTTFDSPYGVVNLGGDDGFFLSMKNVEKMWKPNTPNIVHTFTIDEEGLYFLMYQVCVLNTEKFIFKQLRSTFELDFAYTNRDLFGKVSYLTAGELPLPHMYLYFTVSYAILFGVWISVLRHEMKSGKNTIFAIHQFMTVVIGLKAVATLFESIRYHFIRVHGHAEVWTFLYYAISFVKGSFLFVVILLIGSGWSFVKPFLNVKEKRIIFIVLFLQMLDNIAIIFLVNETEGEKSYAYSTLILHFVDILCCCGVMLPLIWQINSLQESLEIEQNNNESNHKDSDIDTKRMLSRLNTFRAFYLIVIAYIYFTRVIVYLVGSFLTFKHTWYENLLTEIGTLSFYVMTGFVFRPNQSENEYSHVETKDDEDRVV